MQDIDAEYVSILVPTYPTKKGLGYPGRRMTHEAELSRISPD